MSRSQPALRILAAKDAFYWQFELVGGNFRHCTYLTRLCSVCQSLTCSARKSTGTYAHTAVLIGKDIQQNMKKLDASMGWIESIYISIARQFDSFNTKCHQSLKL